MTALAEILRKLGESSTSDADWGKACFTGSPESDVARWKAKGATIYNGKVRDLIIMSDQVLMIHSDRLSAFDRFIGYVPYKGVILNHICKFWFASLKNIIPNHYQNSPHDRILAVKSLTPVKVEVVVRGYLAGSIMRAYQNGERIFCGERLPEGLKPYQKLPTPIITPTTKAAAFEHDENTSVDELIGNNVCSRVEWNRISELAFQIFKHGQEVYARSGWLLADTKYEFGKSHDGTIMLMDEIHTPDSSRLWNSSTYESRITEGLAPEMLDKENIRRFLMDHGFSGHGDVPNVSRIEFIKLALVYLHVLEKLTGEPLEIDQNQVQSLRSIL